MVLVCAVRGWGSREFARDTFRRRRECSHTAERVSGCAAFASPAATTAPTAAASPAAPALTAALAALGAVASNLALLLFAACLHIGARLSARSGCRSAHGRLCSTRVEVEIARRPPLVIAVMLAPISIAHITAASLSLGAPAITMAAPLAAFRAARLPGVLTPAVAMPVAASG